MSSICYKTASAYPATVTQAPDDNPDRHVRTRPITLAIAIAIASVPLVRPAAAQSPGETPRSDTSGSAPAPAPVPQAASPLPFAFSGVFYANYQYGGATGKRSLNRFDLDRAYLNFRTAAGGNDSIRVTFDVYQQRDTTRDAYYRGWTTRIKYAYLQHELVHGQANQLRAVVRLGLLHTVVIDKEEQYWQRGFSQVAIEQNGFFASSDAGIASAITLPNRRGEVYATITNGPGYSSRETDRFKEYAVRLTLTPFSHGSGYFSALEFSPWVSKGDRASDFATARGTVLAVPDARQRDRYGLFVGVRSPKLTLGAQLARRVDVVESADTTHDTVPTTRTRTGSVYSVYGLARPAMLLGDAKDSPLGIVVRVDQVKPDVDADGYQLAWIGGLTWNFNNRTSATLDVQSSQPRSGLTGPDTRVVYLHVISSF